MEELKQEEVVETKKPKLNIKAMRDKHRVKVKGIFRFHECPGALLEFDFREYKGEQITHYKMIDGQMYEIPLGVAIHLNKNCFYPEYSYIKDEMTKDVMKATKKVRRVSFQSLEFVDIEELNPSNLTTVEYASGF